MVKLFKPIDSRFGGQIGRTCNKHGMFRDSTFRGGTVCHKCGKEGNNAKDYQQGIHVCFNCSQVGHFKAKCPLLRNTCAMQTPVPTTLRMDDRRQGKAEAQAPRDKLFNLQ